MKQKLFRKVQIYGESCTAVTYKMFQRIAFRMLDIRKFFFSPPRNAYEAETVQESADLWRKLFGNKFPEAPKQQQAVCTIQSPSEYFFLQSYDVH